MSFFLNKLQKFRISSNLKEMANSTEILQIIFLNASRCTDVSELEKFQKFSAR